MFNIRAAGNMDFMVFVGMVHIGFSKVSNISIESEYDTIQEGGRNDTVYTLSKPKSTQHRLVLEKGVSSYGVDALRAAGLIPGRHLVTPMMIMVLRPTATDGVKMPVRTYVFDEGYITKWELGDLDASGSGVLIDRLEIAHSGLYEASAEGLL